MKKLVSHKCLSLALLAFLLVPLSAYPSVMVNLTRDELVKGSDSIIVGEVVDEYSEWDPSGKFIVTYVRVRLTEDVKGSEAGSSDVIIKKMGGRVGNREMVVHGGPRFVVGEKALLFLQKKSLGYRSVMGFSMGKYRIVRDAVSGVEMAENPDDPELEFLDLGPKVKRIEGKEPRGAKRVNLKEMVDEIKTELKGGATLK